MPTTMVNKRTHTNIFSTSIKTWWLLFAKAERKYKNWLLGWNLQNYMNKNIRLILKVYGARFCFICLQILQRQITADIFQENISMQNLS